MTIDRRAFLAAALSGSVAFPFAHRALAQTEVERVDALIARMTIEEKAGQLNLLNDPFRWRPEGVNPGDFNPDQAAIAADNQVPDTIRSRAVQIAGTLGVDATASLPTVARQD